MPQLAAWRSTQHKRSSISQVCSPGVGKTDEGWSHALDCDCVSRPKQGRSAWLTPCLCCAKLALILAGLLCDSALVGAQIWLSPWQVAHVLSIVSFVESTLHRVIGPEPGLPPTTPISLATPGDQALPTGLAASAMKTQLRLTLSAEIPLISVLCLVSSLHPICNGCSFVASPAL